MVSLCIDVFVYCIFVLCVLVYLRSVCWCTCVLLCVLVYLRYVCWCTCVLCVGVNVWVWVFVYYVRVFMYFCGWVGCHGWSQLLEVHVDHPNQPGRESEELLRARKLLWVSLCNRSVTNMVLGNDHSGTVTYYTIFPIIWYLV